MKKLFIILTILISITFGCKKEESLTESQRTENTLKKELSNNGIRRILTVISGDFEPSVMDADYGLDFAFDNGFLNTTDLKIKRSYDLANLKDHQIKTLTIKDANQNTTKPEKVMVLMFKK